MGFRVDPPDFIDESSYKVTDVKGYGGKAAGLAAGTAVTGLAVAVGLGLARRGEREFSAATGMNTQNENSDTTRVEVV